MGRVLAAFLIKDIRLDFSTAAWSWLVVDIVDLGGVRGCGATEEVFVVGLCHFLVWPQHVDTPATTLEACVHVCGARACWHNTMPVHDGSHAQTIRGSPALAISRPRKGAFSKGCRLINHDCAADGGDGAQRSATMIRRGPVLQPDGSGTDKCRTAAWSTSTPRKRSRA